MEINHGSIFMEALDGDRRRLTYPFNCEIDGVRYTIPAGFVWDGASLPRFAWALHGHPFDDVHRAPGLWHDAAYSGLFEEQGVTKLYADNVYRNWLRANGMGFVQSAVEWLAVFAFGGSHWNALIFIAAIVSVLMATGCTSTRSRSIELAGMYASESGTLAIGSVDIVAAPQGEETATIKYEEDTAWLSPSTKTHEIKIMLTGTNAVEKSEKIVESICKAFVAVAPTNRVQFAAACGGASSDSID